MGLLSALLGNASEVDASKLEKEFADLLIDGETIQHAYKLFRDLIVFTNYRLFLVDKQGMTGKKRQYTSIPYKSIDYFSKETAGHFDLDADQNLDQEPQGADRSKIPQRHAYPRCVQGYKPLRAGFLIRY